VAVAAAGITEVTFPLTNHLFSKNIVTNRYLWVEI